MLAKSSQETKIKAFEVLKGSLQVRDSRMQRERHTHPPHVGRRNTGSAVHENAGSNSISPGYPLEWVDRARNRGKKFGQGWRR